MSMRDQFDGGILFSDSWLMKDNYLAIEIPTVMFLSPTDAWCGYTEPVGWCVGCETDSACCQSIPVSRMWTEKVN